MDGWNLELFLEALKNNSNSENIRLAVCNVCFQLHAPNEEIEGGSALKLFKEQVIEYGKYLESVRLINYWRNDSEEDLALLDKRATIFLSFKQLQYFKEVEIEWNRFRKNFSESLRDDMNSLCKACAILHSGFSDKKWKDDLSKIVSLFLFFKRLRQTISLSVFMGDFPEDEVLKEKILSTLDWLETAFLCNVKQRLSLRESSLEHRRRSTGSPNFQIQKEEKHEVDIHFMASAVIFIKMVREAFPQECERITENLEHFVENKKNVLETFVSSILLNLGQDVSDQVQLDLLESVLSEYEKNLGKCTKIEGGREIFDRVYLWFQSGQFSKSLSNLQARLQSKLDELLSKEELDLVEKELRGILALSSLLEKFSFGSTFAAFEEEKRDAFAKRKAQYRTEFKRIAYGANYAHCLELLGMNPNSLECVRKHAVQSASVLNNNLNTILDDWNCAWEKAFECCEKIEEAIGCGFLDYNAIVIAKEKLTAAVRLQLFEAKKLLGKDEFAESLHLASRLERGILLFLEQDSVKFVKENDFFIDLKNWMSAAKAIKKDFESRFEYYMIFFKSKHPKEWFDEKSPKMISNSLGKFDRHKKDQFDNAILIQAKKYLNLQDLSSYHDILPESVESKLNGCRFCSEFIRKEDKVDQIVIEYANGSIDADELIRRIIILQRDY